MRNPFKRPLQKPVKIGLITVGSIAGLLVIAAIVLAILFPPSKVKSVVLEQASKKLARQVKVDGAHIKLFPYVGVSVTGFEVANNPDSGFSKEPLFKLKELGVELSLKSLIKMTPVVNEIRIIEPQIRMEVLADGRTSLDGLGGPKDTTTPKSDSVKPLTLPFPLTVEKIRIKNGSFTYVDQKKGQNFSVGQLNDVISISTDKKLENVQTKGTLAIRQISVSGTGMPVKKGNISLDFSHDIGFNLPAAAVTIRSAKVSLQKVSMELTGKATNILVRPNIDLRVKSQKIDLAQLLAEVPKGLNTWVDKATLSGSTDFDITAKGLVDKTHIPQASGAIHLVNIGAAVAGVPARLQALNSTITLYPSDSLQGVRIQPMTMNLAGNPISILLDANGLAKAPYLKALDAKGTIDLGAVSKLVPGLDVYALAGSLGFNVKGQGPIDPANPTKLQVNGGATFRNVGAKVPSLTDRVTVNGTASFANTAVGANVAIVTGPSDLSINAKVTDWMAMALPKLAAGKVTSVTANVTSKQIDVDRLLPATSTKTEKKSSGALVIPALPNVKVAANISAALVKAYGLQVNNIKSNTTYGNSQLAMTNKASAYGGTFGNTISANLANTKNISSHVTLNVANVEASQLLPAMCTKLITQKNVQVFAKALSGKANINVDATANGDPAQITKKLSADISASFANGKISMPLFSKMTSSLHKVYNGVPAMNAIDFSTMKVGCKLRDGAMLIENMVMNGNSFGSIDANGTVGLDQSLNLKSNVHLPKSASSAILAGGTAASGYLKNLGLAANLSPATDNEKRVLVAYTIGGTLSSPTFKTDATSMAKNMAKNLVNSLVDQKKAEAQALVDKKKAEAQALADKKKAELQTKANAEKQKLQQQAQQKTDAAKQQATDKAKAAAKSKLKSLGF